MVQVGNSKDSSDVPHIESIKILNSPCGLWLVHILPL